MPSIPGRRATHGFHAAFDFERGIAAAFDQRHPDSLDRLPTICVEVSSTTPDSGRQPVLPVEVVAYPIRVGFVAADEDRSVSGPMAVRLQIGDDLGTCPAFGWSLIVSICAISLSYPVSRLSLRRPHVGGHETGRG